MSGRRSRRHSAHQRPVHAAAAARPSPGPVSGPNLRILHAAPPGPSLPQPVRECRAKRNQIAQQVATCFEKLPDPGEGWPDESLRSTIRTWNEAARQAAADGFVFVAESDLPLTAGASEYIEMSVCAHITCAHQLCRDHCRESVAFCTSHPGVIEALRGSQLAGEPVQDPVSVCVRHRSTIMERLAAERLSRSGLGCPRRPSSTPAARSPGPG